MISDHEAAIRGAVDALVAAILAAATAAAPLGNAPDRLLSVDEAACALGIGRSRLYDEIAGRRIVSIKVGRRRLVPAGAIADFIAAGPDRESGPAASKERSYNAHRPTI